MHYRVMQPVVALRSRASGIVDAWSDAPRRDPRLYHPASAVPHLAAGGGVQYRVPAAKVDGDHFVAL